MSTVDLKEIRVIGAVENIFICFHRFNVEIGLVCFTSKNILQLNFPTITSIDEIKRTIISKRKKKNKKTKYFVKTLFLYLRCCVKN